MRGSQTRPGMPGGIYGPMSAYGDDAATSLPQSQCTGAGLYWDGVANVCVAVPQQMTSPAPTSAPAAAPASSNTLYYVAAAAAVWWLFFRK